MASTTTQNSTTENGSVTTKMTNDSRLLSELTRHNQNENRRTLQTLQYSTGAPISPIRKIVRPQKKNLLQKGQKPITVYVDPPQKNLDNKASQTEKDQNGSKAYNMLVSEEVPESYWKDLAEERRKALDESLHENEMLHKEVTELKEENEKLNKVAGQAEYFANVLKEVLGADEDNDEPEKDHNSYASKETCDLKDSENLDDQEKLGMDELLMDKSNENQKISHFDNDNKCEEKENDAEKKEFIDKQDKDEEKSSEPAALHFTDHLAENQ